MYALGNTKKKIVLGLPCFNRHRNKYWTVFIERGPKDFKSFTSSNYFCRFCDSFQVLSCCIRECWTVRAIVYARTEIMTLKSNACSDWTAEQQCYVFYQSCLQGYFVHDTCKIKYNEIPMRIRVTLLKAPLGHKGPLVQIGRKIIINNFIDFIFDMKISVPKQSI